MHFYQLFKGYRKIKQKIKGKTYTLAIADTPIKKKIGLSKVKDLPRNCGMLFVYSTPVDHSFTMKNTSVPLNIIFLDRNMNYLSSFKCSAYSKKKIKPEKSYSYVIEIPV